MKRFQFSLENVLRIRREEEEEWEIKLARATSECVRVQRRIDDCLAQKDKVNHGMNWDDLYLVQTRSLFLGRLDQQVEKLLQTLSQKEAVREEVRQGYLEVSRRRKILDKLKEKRAAEHHKQALRKEQQQIDELISRSETRKRQQGGV